MANTLKAQKIELLQQGKPTSVRIELINKENFLSTGTSGSNITINSGSNWVKVDDISYNVCRKAKAGSFVLLAGDRGK